MNTDPKKKRPNVRWTSSERLEWKRVLEEEATPRPDGTFAEITAVAMKRMKRPRPVNQPVIKEAGKIIREYRGALLNPKPKSEATETLSPEPVEPPEEPVFEERRAELATPPVHWSEWLAEDVSRLLIEVIVRTAESPAVRKAVRSLITVATDRDFKPEIDNTVPWERPAIGPKLPRVLIVGFWRIGPVRKLADEYGKLLDLRFWRTDNSLNQLRQDLAGAERVVFVAGTSNHTVRQIIVASGKPFITLPLAGGTEMAGRELQKIVDAWKNGRL